MPQSFLIFDFGSDEDAAQKARHGVEGWRQGFRLGQKLALKFDRQEDGEAAEAATTTAGEGKNEGKEKKSAEAVDKSSDARVVMIVRLDFSDHEKLSYQRWLERVPADAAFKDAKVKVVHHGDADFQTTSEKFDEIS